MFLISNAVNAADKWEYVKFRDGGVKGLQLTYPDGKTDSWEGDGTKPPKNFSLLFGPLPPALANRDFTKDANVINALGFFGFEMCGFQVERSSRYWFKRKISK